MDVSSLAATAVATQRTLLTNNLQMAMLKSSIETQSAALIQLLDAGVAATSEASSNPPHLGNLVDTAA